MIAIVVDDHAHRLRLDGLVESANLFNYVDGVEDGKSKLKTGIRDEWEILNPELDLNITIGDFQIIKKQLEELHAFFPADRLPLPSYEKVETVLSTGNELRV